MNLIEILTDLFLDSNDFRDWHTIPIGERLQTVGAAPEQVAELERAWQSALDTHRGTLRRLWHDDTTADDFASSTGTDTRVPTQAELAELTDEQLLESIEACETSLHGCQNAISLLNTREGGTHADFLLGEEAPSELFRQLADWFESALVVLRRLRQWRALADHRTATQFQPLDPSSPSVLVQVRMPESLVKRLDGALAGRSRSDVIREAITVWLGAEDTGSTALVRHQPGDHSS